MKTLLSVLLIFIGILSAVAQDTIPNSGFERWHPYASGSYPDSWLTSDSVSVAILAGSNAYIGSDSYEGASCLHLKSVKSPLVSITGPGIATNGIIRFTGGGFVFSGGSADTNRARYLTGQYKYIPNDTVGRTDAAVVKVYLLRDNAGAKDTIAEGSLELTDTVLSYTQFAVPILYKNYILQPDTCLIILQSSRGLNDPTLGVGSEFIVDSLNFSGFVGIEELQNSIASVNIFPSPADKELSIDVELTKSMKLSYEVFDLRGRLLLSSLMNSTKEKVDISNLASGQYILNIGDEKKRILYSKNFSINR